MASPEYGELVGDVRSAFLSGCTLDLEWRRHQLQQLLKMFTDEQDLMHQAVNKDLHKCKVESGSMEINFGRNEIISHLNNLDNWAKRRYVKKDLLSMMDTCYIRPEPLGVVLIIGAWNYPIQLTLHPLIGAISSGNCAIIKPSELAEATAQLIAELIPKYLDTECFKVINGGIPETTALLKERFDKIFYTGNGTVGKIVMTAAANHLTPVTLELGGKSPCYVHEDSDLDIASRRIVWGKFINCGQTCIAPDYILCTKPVQDKLLARLRVNIKRFFSEDPQSSPDYSRIINTRHFNRIKKLLENTNIAIGGRMDVDDKFIEPTIIVDVKPTDQCMLDEVFGPVLPIMTVKNLDEAIQFIRSREKPLALYVFSNNSQVTEKMLTVTSSGGFLVNDTVLHVSLDTLPFGGVGGSGFGSYHGQFGFDNFSHLKSVMIKKQTLEKVNEIRYPPFSEKKMYWLNLLMKKSLKRSGIWSFYPLLLLGIVFAAIFKLLGLEKLLPKALTE